MNEHKEPIPSMIYNAAVGGHVTNSQQIIDENLNREQNDINQEIVGTVPYNSTNPNGMGRVVLKKNDNFKKVVEAQTKGNTIFVIKYNFSLNDDEVTIPENCILEFNGGSISNGTIIVSDFYIEAGNVRIFKNIKFHNPHREHYAIKNKHISALWFGIVNDNGITDQTDLFTVALKAAISCNAELYFPSGRYKGSFEIIYGKTFPTLKQAGTDIVCYYKQLKYRLSNQDRLLDLVIKGAGINNTIFLSNGIKPVFNIVGESDYGRLLLWGIYLSNFGILPYDTNNNNADAIFIRLAQHIEMREISIHDISGHYIHGIDWMDSTCEMVALFGEGHSFLDNGSYAIYLEKGSDNCNNLRFENLHVEGMPTLIRCSGPWIHFNNIKYEKTTQNLTDNRPIVLAGSSARFENCHLRFSQNTTGGKPEPTTSIDGGRAFIKQTDGSYPGASFISCTFDADGNQKVHWTENIYMASFIGCSFNNAIGDENGYGFNLRNLNIFKNCILYLANIKTENARLFDITGNGNQINCNVVYIPESTGTFDDMINISGINNICEIVALNDGNVTRSLINDIATVNSGTTPTTYYYTLVKNNNKFIYNANTVLTRTVNTTDTCINVSYYKTIVLNGTGSENIDSIIGTFNNGDIITLINSTSKRIVFKRKTSNIGNLYVTNDGLVLDYLYSVELQFINGYFYVISEHKDYYLTAGSKSQIETYSKNARVGELFKTTGDGFYIKTQGYNSNEIKTILDGIALKNIKDFNNYNKESQLIKVYNNVSNYPELASNSVGISTIINLDALQFQLFYNDNGLFVREKNGVWKLCSHIAKTTEEINAITQKYIGLCIFNSDIKKPVWWDGTNWVDATGTTV